MNRSRFLGILFFIFALWTAWDPYHITQKKFAPISVLLVASWGAYWLSQKDEGE